MKPIGSGRHTPFETGRNGCLSGKEGIRSFFYEVSAMDGL